MSLRSYTGAHKQRFTTDGVGMGLEGRREDDEEKIVIAGGGRIVRDPDEEMDSPHKPILPWDAEKRRCAPRHIADWRDTTLIVNASLQPLPLRHAPTVRRVASELAFGAAANRL